MYGVPPTDLNARIEEFTPPGIACADRWKTSSLEENPAPLHTVATQPAAAQRVGSQKGIVPDIGTPT